MLNFKHLYFLRYSYSYLHFLFAQAIRRQANWMKAFSHIDPSPRERPAALWNLLPYCCHL